MVLENYKHFCRHEAKAKLGANAWAEFRESEVPGRDEFILFTSSSPGGYKSVLLKEQAIAFCQFIDKVSNDVSMRKGKGK